MPPQEGILFEWNDESALLYSLL